MRKYRNIYVAASRQHVGKTTSTLGLVAAFMKKGLTVGYSKPVGQKSLTIKDLLVDKDTLLFADLIHFQLDPSRHSPIIIGEGATSEIIEVEDYKTRARERIMHAKELLEKENELVIFEGTGHPGVGSIADISNAQVAKILDAGVIMIVEGGIGKTIDMLNLCLAMFREQDVPIIGVIINKVFPEKMDKVKYYVGKYLDEQGLPLLGVLPYEESLAYPVMTTITKAIHGTVIENPESLSNKVANIIGGSLLELNELQQFQDLLLVVSTGRSDQAIRKIRRISKHMGVDDTPLAGIVITGQGEINDESLEYINQYKIPLVRTSLDTYGSVLKISKIEVKINRGTPWKVLQAIALIENNVDLDRILELAKLQQP